MNRAQKLRGGIAGLLLCLAGCEDNPAPVSPGPEPEPVTRFWSGSFGNATDGGPLVLELVQTGDVVRGEIAFWSPGTQSRLRGASHLYVRGHIRDATMQLELDPDRVDYQFTFTVDGTLGTESQLEGNLSQPNAALSAQFSCQPVERRSIQVTASYVVPFTVSAMAFDGTNLWLSSLERNYVRATLEMEVLDNVGVMYEQVGYWTTSALSYDGNVFWGFLPATTQGPSGTRDESRMMGFDASGQVVSTFYLLHRTHGLAYDGSDYWSLDAKAPLLHRYDTTGTVHESIAIDVPDATDLEADATSFWTTGWFLERLYRLDRSGHVMAVYDLPNEGHDYSSALAREGAAMWHVQDNPFWLYARVYRLLPE